MTTKVVRYFAQFEQLSWGVMAVPFRSIQDKKGMMRNI